VGKKHPQFQKKVRILKLGDFIFSKDSVMDNWRPLLDHTTPFHITPPPICITGTRRRDWKNFFVLSFESEYSSVHKGERIDNLTDK